MSILDSLQSVQYITLKGRRPVVLDADDFEALIERLEDREDLHLATQSIADLKAAHGNWPQAGWLDWDAVQTTHPGVA